MHAIAQHADTDFLLIMVSFCKILYTKGISSVFSLSHVPVSEARELGNRKCEVAKGIWTLQKHSIFRSCML